MELEHWGLKVVERPAEAGETRAGFDEGQLLLWWKGFDPEVVQPEVEVFNMREDEILGQRRGWSMEGQAEDFESTTGLPESISSSLGHIELLYRKGPGLVPFGVDDLPKVLGG